MIFSPLHTVSNAIFTLYFTVPCKYYTLYINIDHCSILQLIAGSLEVKLPTIWRDEKQSREEAGRRERLEERRVEEKE